MKTLNRKDILAVSDIKKELVVIPEWSNPGEEEVAVYVRSLTGKERDEYESAMYKVKNNSVEINLKNIRALICSLSICDEDGKRLFTTRDIEDLGSKSASALDRIANVANRLSGLSANDQKKLSEGLKTDFFVDSSSS